MLPRALNLLTLGDDVAASRGVDVGRAQRLAFFSASLATGAACRSAAPSASSASSSRTWCGCSSGRTTGSCCRRRSLFGAAFLVVCDVIARTAMAPIELPVGIITAMIGGPFFLWLLVTHERS
jgi:iron complex transport system permease protein